MRYAFMRTQPLRRRVARVVAALGLAFAALPLGGCFTFGRGTSERIWVTSSPPGGIILRNGDSVGVTPMPVEVKRRPGRDEVAVRLGSDTVPVEIAHRLSAGMAVYLVFGLPGHLMGLMDMLNGAGFHATSDVVNAQFPATVALSAEDSARVTALELVLPPARPNIDLPEGSRVRLRTGDGPASYAVVHATHGDTIEVSALADLASRPEEHRVRILPDDARSIDVHQATSGFRRGLDGIREDARPAPLFLAFPQGAVATGLLYTASFANGYARDRGRWQPREAQRVGSALLVDDSVYVTLADPLEADVTGSLRDVTRAGLIVRSPYGTRLIPRDSVKLLKRTDGRSYRGAMWVAAAAGLALSEGVCMATKQCGGRLPSRAVTHLLGIGIGVVISPTFAWPRWSDVKIW